MPAEITVLIFTMLMFLTFGTSNQVLWWFFSIPTNPGCIIDHEESELANEEEITESEMTWKKNVCLK